MADLPLIAPGSCFAAQEGLFSHVPCQGQDTFACHPGTSIAAKGHTGSAFKNGEAGVECEVIFAKLVLSLVGVTALLVGRCESQWQSDLTTLLGHLRRVTSIGV